MFRRASGLVATLALTALLAGCFGGGSDPALEASQLSDLVLQPGDLSAEWQEFDRGSQARSDAFLGKPVDAARFGRLGGWKARYRRPGPDVPRGPLVIESKADLFDSSAGASDELERVELLLRQTFPEARIRPQRGVGDRAIAATFAQRAGQFTTRYVVVVWRAENSVGAVFVTGVRGVTVADGRKLADKQQQRIARAARG